MFTDMLSIIFCVVIFLIIYQAELFRFVCLFISGFAAIFKRYICIEPLLTKQCYTSKVLYQREIRSRRILCFISTKWCYSIPWICNVWYVQCYLIALLLCVWEFQSIILFHRFGVYAKSKVSYKCHGFDLYGKFRVFSHSMDLEHMANIPFCRFFFRL